MFQMKINIFATLLMLTTTTTIFVDQQMYSKRLDS